MITKNTDIKMVLVTTITGNIQEYKEVKKYIDVNHIREITECDDYFGFRTTKIIFNNGLQPVHIKLSIEQVFDNLKNAEKIN